MNAEHLTGLLHKGFRVTLGATSSLIEILQDPYKRNENLGKIQSQFSELADEWAEKGKMTEQEARNFVDTILSQRQQNVNADTTTATTPSTVSSPSTIAVGLEPEPIREIQDLTTQIAELRDELKRLRESNSSN
jgi:polyhydroxyalkanoate synthesis regulator phasin